MKYIDAEKLIALLEQRKKQLAKWIAQDYANQRIDEIDCILDVDIDSLQHEQPVINLEEAFDEYIEHKKAYIKDDGVIKYYNGDSFNHIYDIYPIARHFYELGKQNKEPVSEELEEAAEEYVSKTLCDPDDGPSTGLAKESFIAGAEWQKEQMMKGAVEAKIYGYDDGSFELIASWLDMPNNSIYKDGEKVKIIIVKK